MERKSKLYFRNENILIRLRIMKSNLLEMIKKCRENKLGNFFRNAARQELVSQRKFQICRADTVVMMRRRIGLSQQEMIFGHVDNFVAFDSIVLFSFCELAGQNLMRKILNQFKKKATETISHSSTDENPVTEKASADSGEPRADEPATTELASADLGKSGSLEKTATTELASADLGKPNENMDSTESTSVETERIQQEMDSTESTSVETEQVQQETAPPVEPMEITPSAADAAVRSVTPTLENPTGVQKSAKKKSSTSSTTLIPPAPSTPTPNTATTAASEVTKTTQPYAWGGSRGSKQTQDTQRRIEIEKEKEKAKSGKRRSRPKGQPSPTNIAPVPAAAAVEPQITGCVPGGEPTAEDVVGPPVDANYGFP